MVTKNSWDRNKCFKCHEHWIPGHRKVCKFKDQVQLITIAPDMELEEETTHTAELQQMTIGDIDQELHISMHALSGIVTEGQTFPLFLQFGKVRACAQVDTGNSSTFIDPSIISKAAFQVQNHKPRKVTVANGQVLWTTGMSRDTSYVIQGERFNSDFRIKAMISFLAVTGYISIVPLA